MKDGRQSAVEDDDDVSMLDRRVASDTKDDMRARATTAAGTVPELNAVKYTVESVAKCHQANQ